MRSNDGPARRGCWVLLVAALATQLVGCGSRPTRSPAYPVHGEISCGGKPCVGVRAFLMRTDGKSIPEAPMNPRAISDADGRFAFTTYDNGDGAPEGEYFVMLQWATPVRGRSEDRLRGMFDNNNKITFSVKPAYDNVVPPIKLPAVDAAGKPLDMRPLAAAESG
jgi:hypothetical protein